MLEKNNLFGRDKKNTVYSVGDGMTTYRLVTPGETT